MGYRDDFYVPENIVGYTSKHGLDDNPTVYFLHIDEGIKTYGHITQRHSRHLNLGRHEVRTSPLYEMRLNDGCLVEWDGGILIHTSRRNLTRIESFNDMVNEFLARFPLSEVQDTRAILATAIGRHQDIKISLIYDTLPAERQAEIDAEMEARIAEEFGL